MKDLGVTRGPCRQCGCTEDNACPVRRRDGRIEGCFWWPGTNRTLCSACHYKADVPVLDKIVAAFGPVQGHRCDECGKETEMDLETGRLAYACRNPKCSRWLPDPNTIPQIHPGDWDASRDLKRDQPSDFSDMSGLIQQSLFE